MYPLTFMVNFPRFTKYQCNNQSNSVLLALSKDILKRVAHIVQLLTICGGSVRCDRRSGSSCGRSKNGSGSRSGTHALQSASRSAVSARLPVPASAPAAATAYPLYPGAATWSCSSLPSGISYVQMRNILFGKRAMNVRFTIPPRSD